MAIRRISSLLFLLCICFSGVGFAQSVPYWTQNQGTASGPTAMPGGDYASQQFAPAGYYAPPQPMMTANDARPLPGSREALANEMYRRDGEMLMYPEHEERELGKFLKYAFDRSWIRLEYLHWDIQDPGNVVVGADPILGVTGNRVDPRVTREIFDNLTGLSLGFGFAPDLDTMSFNDNNGIRGTFGREDEWGTFIMDFWGIEQASETLNLTRFLREQQPGFFLTTPLKQNGQTSNFALLSDDRYAVQMETGLWGANAEVRYDTGQWPDGMRVQTILGASFTQVHEAMTLVTGFDNQDFGPVLNSSLRSDVQNNMFGPTIGLNADFRIHRLTFGITPKVALNANRVRREVVTTDLAFAGDSVSDRDVDYEFSPILSVNAFVKMQVSESFLLFASYDAGWISRIGKAPSSIDYNDNLATPRTDIMTRSNLNNMTFNGFSVGGELLLY